MDDPALERLLRDLESPSSERKQSFSDADRVCQAICAYSNDMAGSKQPGYRLEIQNPGSLYGDARLEDFPGVTAYRNPVLAEAAKVLGYVNRFGRGLPRILDSMQKNGSSPPRIEPGAGHFLVVLPRHA